MARLTRAEAVVGGAALALAILAPAALFSSASDRPATIAQPAAPPLSLSPQPDLTGSLYSRRLFAPATRADAAMPAPADAPDLLGVAGRIDRDAVALIRSAEGESRTLRPGESVDGWRLVSLSADAAYFTRGREQVRVAVPAGSNDAGFQDEATDQ